MLVWMTSSIEHTREEIRKLETLLSRIAQGDKEALGTLYERTHAAVYGFALSLVRKPSDAEDILQETFLRVYAAAERYRPEGKPMAWMMAISGRATPTAAVALVPIWPTKKVSAML